MPLIAKTAKSVYTDVLLNKLSARLQAFDNLDPQLSIRYRNLTNEMKAYYLGYEMKEMKKVYFLWSGLSTVYPQDWLPAYSRLKHLWENLDQSKAEFVLIDCRCHYFENDLEFLCYGDINKLLSLQEILDLFGFDVKVIEPEHQV